MKQVAKILVSGEKKPFPMTLDRLDRWEKKRSNPLTPPRAAERTPGSLRRERSLRWSTHRSRLREISDDIKRAKRRRDAALGELRIQCERQRKAIQADCAAGRKQIRAGARAAERKAKDRKRKLWETYRIFSGSIAGQLRREYSAAEHDDLTEQNIDPRYLDFFRAHRSLFPRWRSPDDRAVQFGEYVEAHEAEIAAWYAAQAESADAQAAYEKAYLEHLDERGDLDDGELDADDGPGGPGIVYVSGPADDRVLSQLHITSRPKGRRMGIDTYEVSVSHPEGGSFKFDAVEASDGDWRIDELTWNRVPVSVPSPVTRAVRRWVESGQLADEMDEAVPF